jgi:peptidoglycan-associated lipoprotein
MKTKTMKLNKFGNLLVIGLALSVAASGCRKKPVGVTNLPGQPVGTVTEPPPGGPITPARPITSGEVPGGVDTGGHPSNSPDSHAGWLEDAQTLKTDTVYFDFDSSVLKTSEKPKVSAVADYLKANSGKAVRIEGNCDERGTEEYNRSLGERRALAVREELIRLGVDPKDADTISYGKDRPVDPGHDESAWKKNRRDDFVVLSPPK